MLQYLEIRRFYFKEIIIEELQEPDEMYFVQSGTYYVGYEVNKVQKFRL